MIVSVTRTKFDDNVNRCGNLGDRNDRILWKALVWLITSETIQNCRFGPS